MSTPTNPPNALEPQPEAKRSTKQIDEAFEKVAKLAGSNVPPADFFQEFLITALTGIQAPAGAIWMRTPQGFLQLQCQYNLDNVGLDRHKGGRQSHNELLRQAFSLMKPMLLGPFETTGIHEGPPAGNPTEFVNLMAPVQVEKDVVGLVEVWHQAHLDARVQRTCLNYLVQMAGYAAAYVRNQQGKTSAGQEQVWVQLEAFARDIHASLEPTRCAFQIANEGRRIIGCDRLSVAVCHGKKCKIEAVSGSDVVEKRSNLIQLMRALVDATLAWGEKLVYQGAKDEALPPDVLVALDDYLAESNSKLLVLQPLRDERQKDQPGPARSALVMECFESPPSAEPLIARLEIVGRHATTALYNSAEMKRIPLGWMWRPILKVQDGLGGKAKAWLTIGGIAALLGILALCIVPYPLKLEANGQLLPIERQKAFPPHAGNIQNFLIEQNSEVDAGAVLATLYDPELEGQLRKLRQEVISAQNMVRTVASQLELAKDQSELTRLKGQKSQAEAQLTAKFNELQLMMSINHCLPDQPGKFQLVAPKFSPRAVTHLPKWKILDADFREIKNRYVKPSDAVLRLGDCNGPWEIELKIPQKHIGQVLRAMEAQKTANPKLDVDLLVTSVPTTTYRGVLYLDKTAVREAVPNRDDHNESAPVVIAYVSLDDPSIPPELRVPRNLMVSGVEVHAKVRCGDHAMGYSLFYGLWEFLYEKVVFFF